MTPRGINVTCSMAPLCGSSRRDSWELPCLWQRRPDELPTRRWRCPLTFDDIRVPPATRPPFDASDVPPRKSPSYIPTRSDLEHARRDLEPVCVKIIVFSVIVLKAIFNWELSRAFWLLYFVMLYYLSTGGDRSIGDWSWVARGADGRERRDKEEYKFLANT